MAQRRSAELSATLQQLRGACSHTVEALASLIDLRGHSSGRHGRRLRNMSLWLGRAMGMEGPELEAVGVGALLHDIGKIGLPDALLRKQGTLSAEEWNAIQGHCEVGYGLLRDIPFLRNAARIVYEHHERHDGSGYPRRLSGEDIGLGARLLAVVDAYDHLRAPRPGQQALSAEEALEDLRRHSGAWYDPRVVEAFERCYGRIEKAGYYRS